MPSESPTPDNLRSALKERIATKQGTITGSDLAAAVGNAAEAETGPTVDEGLDTETVVPASELPSTKLDDVLGAESDKASGTAAAALAALTEKKKDALVITPAEKRQFLEQAIIGGGRYTWNFECLGGALRAVFRTRSSEEMNAIATQTAKELRTGVIASDERFVAVLVRRLLVCQLERLNDVELPRLAEPLFETVRVNAATGKTEHVMPGWLTQVEEIFPKSEALAETLMGGLREFELRYQLMLEQARNVDFWKPVE